MEEKKFEFELKALFFTTLQTFLRQREHTKGRHPDDDGLLVYEGKGFKISTRQNSSSAVVQAEPEVMKEIDELFRGVVSLRIASPASR